MKNIKCEVLEGVAELHAIYDPNAQNNTQVFFYDGNSDHWSLTYWQLREIWASRDFRVIAKSNKADRGLFNIGHKKNWYYSHSLFSSPSLLEHQIQNMIQFSLIGTTSDHQESHSENNESVSA